MHRLKAELAPLQNKLISLQATHKQLTEQAEAQNAQVAKARADLKLFRKKHSE
jgi:multidrug resistance efflux pump